MRATEQNVINSHASAIDQSAAPSAADQNTAAIRTLDAGKIRTGAGCRIAALAVRAKRTADSGRIRMGAGCRIRRFAKV